MPLVVSTGPVLSGRVTDKVESHLARRTPDGHLVHVATVLNDPALATQMAAAEDMRNLLVSVLADERIPTGTRRAAAAVLARAGVEVPGNHVAADMVVEITQAEINDQRGPDVDKPGFYTRSEVDGELVKGPFDTREQAAAQL